MSIAEFVKQPSLQSLSAIFGGGPAKPGDAYGAPGTGSSRGIAVITIIVLLAIWWYVTGQGWIKPLFKAAAILFPGAKKRLMSLRECREACKHHLHQGSRTPRELRAGETPRDASRPSVLETPDESFVSSDLGTRARVRRSAGPRRRHPGAWGPHWAVRREPRVAGRGGGFRGGGIRRLPGGQAQLSQAVLGLLPAVPPSGLQADQPRCCVRAD